MTKTYWTLFTVLTLASPLAAGYAGHGRSYYSPWLYYTKGNYYFTSYNFYSSPDAKEYSHHYCFYYTNRPRYFYYYNPQRKVYWGRYDIEAKGYSLLAEKDRKEKLSDIPEEAFPKPGKMPAVPGTSDNLQLADPPAPPEVKKP